MSVEPSPSTFSLGKAVGVFIGYGLKFCIFDSSLSITSVLTFSPSFLGIKVLLESVLSVLDKREVQFALMTGIELDLLAEKKLYQNKELEAIVRRDEGLFGTDEVLAYSICNLYGSIALTNFGFIDKQKYGVVARLNEEGKDGKHCHTFLDDMVAAIAAAAASRFAHS
jgi:phosphatidylglycerophosphatase A